jgi:hypothetical protein
MHTEHLQSQWKNTYTSVTNVRNALSKDAIGDHKPSLAT